MSAITILIPTLNEAENIDLLVARILHIRQSSQLDFDILFVDSASTDGTCDKVLAWQKKAPVRLLSLDCDMGLAGAVMAGARYTDARYMVVMDADLSHPPEVIPQLLQPLLDDTHNMVIGSRYTEGGTLPDWPFMRRLASRIATLPALLFCTVKDPLSGFFAVERRRLSDMSDSVPGFKIGLAVLAYYRHELRVMEVPIEFRDRDYGQSKMNHQVALAYLKQLMALCYKARLSRPS